MNSTTNKEAIAILNGFDLRNNADKYDIEALDMGIEALEKQTPVKFKNTAPCHVKAFDGEEKVFTYECLPCPLCGKWIVNNPIHKYCEYCGQALEFGNTKSETSSNKK